MRLRRFLAIVGSVLLRAASAHGEEPPAAPSTSDAGPPAAPAPAIDSKPSAIAGPTGFGVKSEDGAFTLYFHWLLQTDYQTFLADKPPGVAARDAFLVRFAGMQMDATIHDRFHSQIFIDFSQSKVTLYDAWVEALIAPELRVRVGKFQFPISEERLTPGIALPFVSTSLASVLLPSRDTGVQVYGNVGDGVLHYNVALTNGAYAGTLSETDVDSEKDGVARAFVRPFVHTSAAPIRKLGVESERATGCTPARRTTPSFPSCEPMAGRRSSRTEMTRRPRGPLSRRMESRGWFRMSRGPGDPSLRMPTGCTCRSTSTGRS